MISVLSLNGWISSNISDSFQAMHFRYSVIIRLHAIV